MITIQAGKLVSNPRPLPIALADYSKTNPKSETLWRLIDSLSLDDYLIFLHALAPVGFKDSLSSS